MGTQNWNGAVKPIAVVRLVIDLAFTVLLLCALMYRATGDTAHEWIGVSACAVCIVHHAFNWKWYKNIFKGSYNVRRGMLTTVNLLLVFAFVTLIITGLLHSRTVLAFLHLPGDMLIRQTHTTAAYWCLPLISAHLGLNWEVILNAFRKMLRINRENHIRKMISRIAAIILAAFGVWSSFDRDIFSKLFLGFSFDYWPGERPIILFFAANLSIMGLYVCAVYYALKSFDWLRRRNNGME
jgi:hypothetical protein